jgi:hypothetical protein
MLPRETYLPPAGRDTALWCSVSYIDGKLTREELWKTSGESDAYLGNRRRVSADNGRTWSAPVSIEAEVVQDLPGGGMVTYPGGSHLDRRTGIRFERRLRRMWPGRKAYDFDWAGGNHPFNDHVFVVEDGHEQLLGYEEGPDFEPDDPFAAGFRDRNRAYPGQSFAFAPGQDPTVYYPMVCYGEGSAPPRAGGVVLMRREADGRWLPSTQRYLDPALTSRGLLEPDAAVLRDGRVLVVCRGSNTDTTPGRKWFCVSDDGGRTLSPVAELRYDDGSRFYSPSSIHYFCRSSRNGRLYWVANITPGPPDGNGPRYPLTIAEIDEDNLAVKRDSLLLVDDRGEDEPDTVQLSNFCLLEDRESLDIELYMTRIGQDPEHFWGSGVYRYIFSPPV